MHTQQWICGFCALFTSATGAANLTGFTDATSGPEEVVSKLFGKMV